MRLLCGWGRSRVAGGGIGEALSEIVLGGPTAALAGLLHRRVFALHLRHYNDALLIHDTVRAVDALATLQDFYNKERATKTQVMHAERWLLELFDGEF